MMTQSLSRSRSPSRSTGQTDSIASVVVSHRIDADHRHPEGPGPAGDLGPDLAHPDDAERAVRPGEDGGG